MTTYLYGSLPAVMIEEPTAVQGLLEDFNTYVWNDAPAKAEALCKNGNDPIEVWEKYGEELLDMLRNNNHRAVQAASMHVVLLKKMNDILSEMEEDARRCYECGDHHNFVGKTKCEVCGETKKKHHKLKLANKPVELYRQYGKWLRRAMKQNIPSVSSRAQLLLASLTLGTQTAYNELETPGWMDSYTLEPVEDEDYHEVNSWAKYIAQKAMELYPDSEEDQDAFISANSEAFDTDDEYIMEELEEDRGFLPDYMKEEYPITTGWQIRGEVLDVAMAAQDTINDLRDEINETMATFRVLKAKGDWKTMKSMKGQTGRIKDAIEAVKQGASKEITAMIRSWRGQHEIQDRAIAAAVVDDWFIDLDHFPTISTFLDDNPEVLDAVIDGAQMRTDPLVSDYGEIALKSHLEQFPIYADNPRDTRAWQEGYVRAVAAGANIIGENNATDKAWDFYRNSISPEGQARFVEVFNATKNLSRAWAAFYREGRRIGQIWSVPVSVNSAGITVRPQIGGSFRQKLNWNQAARQVKDGRLVITDIERARELLSKNNWGEALLAALVTA